MNKPSKCEDKHEGLKERVAKKVGAQLEKMATDMRVCWMWSIYEPEMPLEIIEDIVKNQ